MKKLATIIVLFGALVFFALPAVADKSPTLVKIEDGKIDGVFDNHNTLAWKGIPFAKPPVGDLRWKRPDDPDRWGGVKQADEFCEVCTQYVEFPPQSQSYFIIGSEDCLYLNVWRPNSEEKDLPVYFWIHGGGNSIGSSSYTSYDGSKMASNSNFIVVSTNYRLGPLGWFSNPVLRKGKRGTAISDSGNYGTLDIIMALKWVRENIQFFGGDPNNVTIAGESAGAFNVYSLLLSPVAARLFHKAIAQSGGPNTSLVADGDASSDRVIDDLMAIDEIDREGMKDCQIADYLRSKTAAEILSLYTPGLGGMLDDTEFLGVFQDGTVIHAAGGGALFLGEYNKVPIILGTTDEEMKMFISDLYYTMSPCAYQDLAANLTAIYFDPAVDAVAQLLCMHQTDIYAFRFMYGAYRYIYDGGLDYNDPNNCGPDPGAFNAWVDLRPYGGPNLPLMLGAWHSLDIPFFFGNFEMMGLTDYIFHPGNSLGYEDLSDAMMAYVAQFAWTGDPGNAGGVQWDPWTNTASGPRILFDADATQALIEMSVP